MHTVAEFTLACMCMQLAAMQMGVSVVHRSDQSTYMQRDVFISVSVMLDKVCVRRDDHGATTIITCMLLHRRN